jgi:tetratricopeptide (TPR) repeat protein
MKLGWLSVLTFGLLLSLCLSPAIGASEFLDKAIAAYNAGKYSEAMGLLGEAESRDFNDPVLHYYLANTLSHLDAKEEAIKEYKIALAMEPEGQIAQYCHDALRALGAEARGNNLARGTGNAVNGGDGRGRAGLLQQFDPVKIAQMNDDRERMQQQIDQIRQQAREIIANISRDTPDRQYAIQHFRDEAQKKVQALRDQFSQRWHLTDAN